MRSLFFCLLGIGLFAQTPPASLEGPALRTWLKENFYDGKHQSLGYSAARQQMYNIIDNHNDTITCVYGGYQKSWQYGGTGTNPWPINCEHTIPQSFFDQNEPMRSDIHHLFPTFADWNSRRSNFPFEEIDDVTTQYWIIDQSESGSIPTSNIDSYSEGTSSSFEPQEAHKGNVARAIFYFFTMYPQYDMSLVGDIDLFYEWHLDDPVDVSEMTRNEAIEGVQGSRNPYIDHPEWVARAWSLDSTTIPGDLVLQNHTPVQVVLSQDDTQVFQLQLPAQVQNLTVSISGSNGDGDLYVKRGIISWPGDQGSHNEPEFKAPYAVGSNEEVVFSSPAAGEWQVLLHGYEACDLTVQADWDMEATPTDIYIANGGSESFSIAQDETVAYKIDIPANAVNLQVQMSGTGAADLYVKRLPFNWPADKGFHDETEFKAPYINGTNESVVFDSPAADTWNILIHGFRASTGTVSVTWDTTTAEWQYESWIRETPHNYANNQTYTYSYEVAGAQQVALHFDRLDTEANYDFLNIYDANGIRIYHVSGNKISSGTGSVFDRNDGWVVIDGSKITVELVTDYSITRYGLKIDQAGYFP